jgi:hypothetical protein
VQKVKMVSGTKMSKLYNCEKREERRGTERRGVFQGSMWKTPQTPHIAEELFHSVA